MKASKCTDAQKAFISKQSVDGTPASTVGATILQGHQRIPADVWAIRV